MYQVSVYLTYHSAVALLCRPLPLQKLSVSEGCDRDVPTVKSIHQTSCARVCEGGTQERLMLSRRWLTSPGQPSAGKGQNPYPSIIFCLVAQRRCLSVHTTAWNRRQPLFRRLGTYTAIALPPRLHRRDRGHHATPTDATPPTPRQRALCVPPHDGPSSRPLADVARSDAYDLARVDEASKSHPPIHVHIECSRYCSCTMPRVHLVYYPPPLPNLPPASYSRSNRTQSAHAVKKIDALYTYLKGARRIGSRFFSSTAKRTTVRCKSASGTTYLVLQETLPK